MQEPTPLLEEIEGREQDDRAALRAAWKRIQYDRGRRLPTDLHVREFIFYVFATDRSGRGVQLSFADVAKELECKERTARHVVERAAVEYGLVEAKEQRYVTGGQSANRYSIDWPVVRSINAGRMETRRKVAVGADAETRPGDNGCQPPVNGCQGGDNGCQPYKEQPRTIPRIKKTHSLANAQERSSAPAEPTAGPDPWKVVVSAFVGFGMSDTGARKAVTSAQSRELTPEDAGRLIEHWERLRAHRSDVTVGWLYRWMTGASNPPPARIGGAERARAVSLTSEATRREMIRSRIVLAGRRAGASESEIEARVCEALAALAERETVGA
jgi:hypothetical protein